MEYKLAKELEKAGFPQGMGKGCTCYDNKTKEIITDYTEGDQVITDCVKIPSLEELIDACGDEFEALIKQSGGWNATNFQANGSRKIKIGPGETPTEAVARLWLVLNK